MRSCGSGSRAVLLIGLLLATPAALCTQTNHPPYVWRNVVIRGGGFVTGVLFHPQEKNLVYARTDVGGAYRWDASTQQWIPLTDWVEGIDFTGIESFAVDPSDSQRLYLAAGIYRRTRAAILRSDDRGRTWQVTEVPFKMGGNEPGRFNGERLAVDPHDGRILFFGSRHDGLWKSADRGATWSPLYKFPKIDTTELPPPELMANARRFRFRWTPPEIGIVFVQFDPHSGVAGKPTPTIYAGVSTTQTNFFRSNDGGMNWQPVPQQPLGLRPNHAVLSSDGIMYLTYGKEAGPTAMTDGAVWKFNTHRNTWTNITPLKSPDDNQPFGYGAVTVDTKHPATVVVTTFGRWHPHDEIFRSTNGGASWTALLQNATWDYSSAPYTKSRVPHWMGSVQVDPFASNHILFTTGYGIWGCQNLTEADAGKPTAWTFCDDGLEETVPLALISPPEGAHLLSGLGDIDGFRHDNFDQSPPQGTFAGAHFGNTEDLAFAANMPSTIVRTGTSGNSETHAAISFDGGKNWTALGQDPPDSYGAGTIAISSDAKTIVWTPRRSVPSFSVNCGTNWTACAGLSRGFRVLADAVNPLRFYAFDPAVGKLLTSTNGAVSFEETSASLPSQEEVGFGMARFHALSVTPGKEGDLWLAWRDNGLYHSTNGGTSFTRLENVKAADSLGFGKAAAGETFPALYLDGTIGSQQGLFRSDDAGKNWIRINDDQHQYGMISRVTGDPRIFGRVYFATSGRGVIYGDERAK
ncbi:MAG TPA: cellulase [Verrucomicrobiae bacterium]|nr:cellulase [Verrucomicrobiae bacterium]